MECCIVLSVVLFVCFCTQLNKAAKLSSENLELDELVAKQQKEIFLLSTENEKLKKRIKEKDKEAAKLSNENKLYNFWYPAKIIPQDKQYKRIKDLIEQGKNVFITGGAGTGKSFILQKLKQIYKDDFYLTAFTGIAAANIGGVTLHSFCGISKATEPPNEIIKQILEDDNKKILRETIKKTKMLAIDEISMCSMYLLEYVDEVLKGVRKSELPFGGVQIIAVGDFMQLPPVIEKTKYNKKTNRREKHECEYKKVCNCRLTWKEQCECKKRSFAFHSDLFKDFEVVNLTEIKRQEEEGIFASVLNELRWADKEKINKKFEEFFKPCNVEKDQEYRDKLHLFADNTSRNNHNNDMLAKLETEEKSYYSQDSFKPIDEEIVKKKIDISKELDTYTRFEQVLKLKEGCRVMLVKNLDVSAGLCNGAVGTVKKLEEESVTVDFDNKKTGLRTISGNTFELKLLDGNYIRKQIPLVVAYAVTIHKSQGLTLDEACIDMQNIFTHGQAYVALSRLKNLSGLKIIGGYNSDKVYCSEEAKKYYKQHNITSTFT